MGLGGTGSAALRFLAEGGHEAVGFERFAIGHANGSSHGESRIIRYTYPDPLYTQMMADAYPLWDDLQKRSKMDLFVKCKGLYFGPESHQDILNVERSLLAANLPYAKFSAEAAVRRWPAFRFEEHEVAIFQEASGFLRSTDCIKANIQLAREAGAVVIEEAQIESIEDLSSRYDAVIVSAGAWIGQLIPNLPLRVTRQQLVYLGIEKNRERFDPGNCPVWIDAGFNFYGFPSDGRIDGVKVSSNDKGEVVAPDSVERRVDEGYIDQVRRYAAHRFPDLNLTVTFSQVCLYTNTPDEDFLIDRVPGLNNTWCVSGCSGHGFKFTVLLGKIAAGLAEGKPYEKMGDRFSMKRFFSG